MKIFVYRVEEQFTENGVYIPQHFRVSYPTKPIDKRIEVTYSPSSIAPNIAFGDVSPLETDIKQYEYRYMNETRQIGDMQTICRYIHQLAAMRYTFPTR